MSWLVAAANTPGDCISGIFHQFWPQTVNGITQGSIIALIALGYTMVYGVLQLINFAHSEVFMIGTVITLYAFRNWFGVVNPIGGFGQIAVIVGSMIPAMFFCALTAVVLERVAYAGSRLAGSIDTGYGNSSQFNHDVGRLMVQLTDAARSVRVLADLLSRHPEALIRGRTDQGP